jgi:hypothetical protein
LECNGGNLQHGPHELCGQGYPCGVLHFDLCGEKWSMTMNGDESGVWRSEEKKNENLAFNFLVWVIFMISNF